jgi:serine/threonine protein phosphatase PrpC
LDRRWGHGTDRRLRNDNQDTHGIFVFGDYTLVVVCDGMGGHHGGAHASSLAVRTLHDVLRAHEALVRKERNEAAVRDALVEAISRANLAIYDTSRRSHRLAGMGSTIAAVLLGPEVAHVAHVGDSRVNRIRNGVAEPLTRDHTMVNLFVEAELLSPEDAASHPEAHVLSRSLGVERQVEVDVHESLDLQYADAFVVCSDGVHGCLSDRDLQIIDWSDPQEGVDEALRVVATRDGDDNATACAVIVGEFDGPPSPTMPPPVVEAVDDSSTAFVPGELLPPPPPAPTQSMGALLEIPMTPAPSPQKAQTTPTTPQNRTIAPPPPLPPPLQREAPKQRDAAKPSSGPRPLLIGLVAVLGISILVIGGAAVLAGSAIGKSTESVPVAVPANPEIVGEVVNHIETPNVNADAVVKPVEAPVVAPKPITGLPLFTVELPPEPRRAPHRPMKFLAPPPGGTEQVQAMKQARNHDCAASLETLESAVKKSPDYAVLYLHTWDCFNKTDQKPLLDAQVATLADIPALLVHFEGKPDPTRKAWGPASAGLDLRMSAYELSNENDLLRDAILDRLGDATVADHLGRDLYLSARLAAGLATADHTDSHVVDWWARRLYIAVRSRQSAVGQLLETERPDLLKVIDDLMATATLGEPVAVTADPKLPSKLPEPVRKAWSVALGVVQPPDAPKPPTLVRKAPKVPVPEAPPDPNEGYKYYKPPKMPPQ